MKLFFLLFISAALIQSCATDNTSDSEEQAPKVEVDPVLMDSLTGMYSAILPCDDCPGKQYFLVLRSDFEYETVEKKSGDLVNPINKSGMWYLTEDSVIVLKNHVPDQSYYKIDGPRLRMMDAGMNLRTGPTANQYVLIRLRNEPPPSRHELMYTAKLGRGIDFYGHGYEPAEWNIDVDLEGWAKLKADTLSLITPSPRPVESSDPNVEGLAIETSLGMLTMQITNTPCIDARTGKRFNQTVSVQLGSDNFQGCGNWIMENKNITSDTMR